MLEGSKTNSVLLSGFDYNGKMKDYLNFLTFKEAKAVFMLRYRMLPTRTNCPGRWSSSFCGICGNQDTDKHLFHCPGFIDLLHGLAYEMFFDKEVMKNKEKMRHAAQSVMKVEERLQLLQGMI